MGFSSALKYALVRLKCPDLELKDKQKEAIAIFEFTEFFFQVWFIINVTYKL